MSRKTIILPRFIRNNRGDIVSRYGFLKFFFKRYAGMEVVIVTDKKTFDIDHKVQLVKNGPLMDLIPSLSQYKYLKKGNYIFWACGHDFVDESSLLLTWHMLLKFLFYRMLGLKIYIVAQGAGPVKTKSAKFCIRRILSLVENATFRDLDSLSLVRDIAGVRFDQSKLGLVADTALLAPDMWKKSNANPKILGVNLRRWHHFDNSPLPYEYRLRLGLIKNPPGYKVMQNFIKDLAVFLDSLIDKYSFEIRFVPMYPSVGESWEDDYRLAEQTIELMMHRNQTEIMPDVFKISELFKKISDVDLMLGTRLHSTIISTSIGIPSIHLSYSPKGFSYFKSIGEEKYCIPLESLTMEGKWRDLTKLFDTIWHDYENYSKRLNYSILKLKKEAEKAVDIL